MSKGNIYPANLITLTEIYYLYLRRAGKRLLERGKRIG